MKKPLKKDDCVYTKTDGMGAKPAKPKKKKKRAERTTKSQIVSALRRLFLRSPERAAALKRDGYTCQECGSKQSKAKGREVSVRAHHKNEVNNWNEIVDAIMAELLCHPDFLETLCKECHKQIHAKKETV